MELSSFVPAVIITADVVFVVLFVFVCVAGPKKHGQVQIEKPLTLLVLMNYQLIRSRWSLSQACSTKTQRFDMLEHVQNDTS